MASKALKKVNSWKTSKSQRQIEAQEQELYNEVQK
jgi:hypothetical protein